VRTVLSKVIIPILNINMKRGFPLPVIPAIDLQDADVRYDDGCILMIATYTTRVATSKPSLCLWVNYICKMPFLNGR
jgi:hypothetical protein